MFGPRTAALVVLVSVLLTVATMGTAAAQSAPGCSTVEYDGEGTEAEPYEVESVGQLQCIKKQGLDANYTLVSDIDASGTEEWNDGAGFEPIGEFDETRDTEFNGTFDGNGHRITSLTIERKAYVGLFGSVGSAGMVTKVSVVDADVTGFSNVGVLSGYNDGMIRQSSANGTVTGTIERGPVGLGGLVGNNGGVIELSSAEADVRLIGDGSAGGTSGGDGTPPDPPPSDIGGFSGFNLGVINRSRSTGDVKADGQVGGFVGWNGGRIAESYATGDVDGDTRVGGFVSRNEGIVYHKKGRSSSEMRRILSNRGVIQSSYATGNVTGSSDVGAFVSLNVGSTVKRSYATGKVTGSETAGFAYRSEKSGGTVAESYWDVNATCQSFSDGGTGLMTSEMTGDNASENMEGFNFTDTWRMTSGYPDLRWQEGGSDGEREDVECGTERDDSGDSDGSNEDGENNTSNESTQPTPGFTALAALVAFVAGIAVIAKRERK